MLAPKRLWYNVPSTPFSTNLSSKKVSKNAYANTLASMTQHPATIVAQIPDSELYSVPEVSSKKKLKPFDEMMVMEEEEEEGDENRDMNVSVHQLNIANGLRKMMGGLSKEIKEKCGQKEQRAMPTNEEEMGAAFKPSTIETGNAIYRYLFDTLDSFDTEKQFRSKEQRLLHLQMAGGVTRIVYGKAFTSNELEIQRINRFLTVRQELFLTAPRRGGKTTTVVQFVAACLWCIPNLKCILFAPGARAAGGDSGFMGHLKRLFKSHKTFQGVQIGTENEETFSIIVDGNERFFHAYPGGASHK